MPLQIVLEGDLLDQPAEVIVNAWNRNIIPWWCCCPRVSLAASNGAVERNLFGRYEGFEQTPEAFIGLFRGDNTGKAIVKL